MTRLRRGNVVAIDFLDHVQDGKDPLEFRVFGRVIAVDRRSITVAAWEYADQKAPDHNCTTYTIVRSTITHLATLEQKGK